MLQALSHICQGWLRLGKVRHNIKELADADATHRLIHIVLQALGPVSERFLLHDHSSM